MSENNEIRKSTDADVPYHLRAVWATQECRGKHTLDEWVADPT